MIDDDRLEQAKKAAALCGIEAARKIELDFSGLIACPVPDCFGTKWQAEIIRIKDVLDRDCQSDIYLYAAKSFAYAKNHAAAFLSEMRIIRSGRITAPDICTPNGYADAEGWASTLYDHLECETQVDDVLNNSKPLDKKILTEWALGAIAVLWFYDAASQYESKPVVAFDTLYEVSEAMAYAGFSYAWVEATKLEKTESREKASSVARGRAFAKHAAHAKAKEKLIGLWKSGDYKNRIECVETELQELIAYCGKPIAFKVARGWLTGIEKD